MGLKPTRPAVVVPKSFELTFDLDGSRWSTPVTYFRKFPTLADMKQAITACTGIPAHVMRLSVRGELVGGDGVTVETYQAVEEDTQVEVGLPGSDGNVMYPAQFAQMGLPHTISEPVPAVLFAVHEGMLEALGRHLAAGVSPDLSVAGVSLLSLAVRKPNPECLIALLQAGANVEAMDPLTLARIASPACTTVLRSVGVLEPLVDADGHPADSTAGT